MFSHDVVSMGASGRRPWHVDEVHLKARGRRCYQYRALDRSGDLVTPCSASTAAWRRLMRSSAQPGPQSASSLTGPPRMAWYLPSPGAIRSRLGRGLPTAPACSGIIGSSRIAGASKAGSDVCAGLIASPRPGDSVEPMMSFEASSVLAPVTTSMFLPTASACFICFARRPFSPRLRQEGQKYRPVCGSISGVNADRTQRTCSDHSDA